MLTHRVPGAAGCTLAYTAIGRGTGFAVIHGGFASLDGPLSGATHTEPQQGQPEPDDLEFARRFRVVLYDRRGCYRSESVTHGYEIDNQALDLKALLDAEGITSAHVLGSSSGGPVAIAFANLFPGLVLSLSLVGTGAFLFPPHPLTEALNRQLHVLDEFGPLKAFETRPPGVETTYAPLWRLDELAARGELEQWEASSAIAASQASGLGLEERVKYHTAELESFRPYLTTDVSAAAASLRVPTLVVHGQADREVPVEWGRSLSRMIPGAQLVEIPDGNHGLFWRDSRARRAVLDFISDASPDSSMNRHE